MLRLIFMGLYMIMHGALILFCNITSGTNKESLFIFFILNPLLLYNFHALHAIIKQKLQFFPVF